MFERYNDQAKRIIINAQAEARALNHHFVGTEHLLLALTRDNAPASRAHCILASLGISHGSVLDHTVRDETEPGNWHLPFTPAAKEVLDLAWTEAGEGEEITAEHILLALTCRHDGAASRVLDAHSAAIREDAISAGK
ncbi:Clp domain protein (plasmid) [Pseudarthrobacter chlorophenolicus A6]|uniref:Clp domain protein n=1 Tax=Pseudarthrobacter chlorophenolicus (strain ATCC 700700 / DSM 12829 / CIP 107037 / JCM 12360 / KCTC 9906 / NCIMB 13794 / A6) TaxID=452863 RepID=B8HIE4_PSECP|nr:Clp protease N-terminal domain-containing protein [Pseudarthrobacter chlorophenolicus]ACL42191.1 Clp domain protein [Pseudarthrobacter chlorophenolicus A6]SDQ14632.1 ATP-dependent Clp protease ATP-binding subunit ClpC [Pseudarthrobacter chlorophenolicus]